MANDNNKVQFDATKLDNLIKSFKQDYFLRVGVLGSKAKNVHDNKSKKTTADIGTFHEFGTANLPRRSFLEDSLKHKIKFTAEEFRKIKKSLAESLLASEKPNIKNFLMDLGSKCLQYIDEGFDTNGFGKWQSLSDKKEMNRRHDEAINKAFKNYNRIEKAMLKGKMEYDKNTLNDYIQEILNASGKILQKTGKLKRSIAFKVLKRQ